MRLLAFLLPLLQVSAAYSPCPAGSYSSALGTTACFTCASGTYSPAAGVVGNSCSNCAPGTYSGSPGASTCVYCPSGTYDLLLGGSSACATCSAGKSSLGLGLTSCSLCALPPPYTSISFVADSGNDVFRALSLSNGSVARVSGIGSIASSQQYDGPGTNTGIYSPYGMFFSQAGDYLYFTMGKCLRQMSTLDGLYQVTTLAGFCNAAAAGYSDGPGCLAGICASCYLSSTCTAVRSAINNLQGCSGSTCLSCNSGPCTNTNIAQFQSLFGGAISVYAGSQTMYLTSAYVIRKIDLQSFPLTVATLLGNGVTAGCSPGPTPFSSAYVGKVQGIYASASGTFLLVLDTSMHVLYYLDLLAETITVIAGQCNTPGYADGVGTAALFNGPRELQVVPDESFALVADTGNYVVRKVVLSSTPVVSTIIGTPGTSGLVSGLGTSALIGGISGMGLSPTGSLLYMAYGFNRIGVADLSVSPVNVTVFSGSGAAGLVDGPAATASFNNPENVRTYGCPVICPANYYVIVGSTVCTACPANSVSSPRAITCTANAGYYVIGSTVSPLATAACQGPCVPGEYVISSCTSANTSMVCGMCVNYGSLGIGHSSTFSSQVNSVSCSTCSSGCPAGTFLTSACNITSDIGCTRCPAGSYGQGAQSVCQLCTPGSYSSAAGASACTACPVGMYVAGSGAVACVPCPAGASANSAGSSVCTQCQPGYYSLGGTSSVCTTCQPGTQYSLSASGVQCNLCAAGTYSSLFNSSKCSNCSSGWFSSIGSSVCQTCPAGMLPLSITTAVTPLAPISPTATPGFAVTVGVGQYCSQYQQAYTFNINLNYPDDLSGIGAELACANPVYQFCPWSYENGNNGCNVIVYSPTQDYDTWSCAAGCVTASPCTNGVINGAYTGPGLVGNPTSCPFVCNPGYVWQNGVCVLLANCTGCAAGTYSYTNSSACTACAVGMYASSSSSICASCAIGQYASTVGSSLCVQCSLGTYANGSTSSQCTACSAGSFANRTGGSTCISCSAAQYQNVTGATTCIPCQLGTYAPGSAAPLCFPCAAGAYSASASSACTACAVGTYANASGASACTQCTCANGYYRLACGGTNPGACFACNNSA